MRMRMLMRMKAAVLTLLIAGLAISCPVTNAFSEKASTEPILNQPALPLVAIDLKGQALNLENMRGKVVLVNFWATWCVPCRKEIPMLDAFYRRYRDRGLEVIAISIDRASELAKVRKTANMVSYPVVMAAEISDKRFGLAEGVPATFVIDSNGIVRDKFIDIYDQLLTGVVVPLLPRETR